MKKNFLIFIIIFFSIPTFSQIKNLGNIPFINNYSPEEYQAARQNWIVVQDHRGLMYFGNTDGSILEFDGQNWNNIKVGDNSVAALCVDNSNKIFVGGDNTIGYLTPNPNGKLVFKSLKELIPYENQDFRTIWDIFITKDSSVFFQTFDELFLYKNDTIIALDIEDYFPEGLFLISFQVNEDIYIYTKYKGIYKLDGNNLDFVEGSSGVSNSIVRAILEHDNDSLLIFTWWDGTFLLKDGILTQKPTPIDSIINFDTYRVIKILNDYYGFQLHKGGYLITDENFKVIQYLTSKNGLRNDIVRRAMVDNQKNLWLCTENGISSVYLFSPFTIFDQYYGFDNESSSFSSKLYNSNLYVGTTAGVFYKKWNEYEDKLLHKDFQSIHYAEGNTKTHFMDTLSKLLLVASESGLYSIKDNSANFYLEEGTERAMRGVKIFRKPYDNDETIIGLARAITIFKKEDNTWKMSHDIQDISGSYLEQDEKGYFWITDKERPLIIRIKFDEEYNEIKETVNYDSLHGYHGLPPHHNYRSFKLGSEVVFTSDSGIYKFDHNTDSFYRFEELNELIGNDASVSFIMEDTQKNIWYKEEFIVNDQSTWELCCLRLTDTGYVKLNKQFLPLKSKIFFFDQISENTYIIGGPSGFIHYDATIVDNFELEFPAFIRSVKITNIDSTIFNGAFITSDSLVGIEQLPAQIPIIPHKFANLRFTFSGSYYQSPDKIEYTYFLEGNDDRWSEWTTENYKDYSNLKPGEYSFQVKARNIYTKESTIATYEFIVKPPWYLTVVAFFIYFVLAGLIIWLIVYLYTRRLRLQKEYLELQVKLRTKEIEMQKEEIESQRDQLAEQNEEIQKINKDITSSIEYAKRIQTAMLPLDSNIQQHLKDYFILFKPRDIVSGDFYWFSNKNGKTFITAVDCTGHGVPGAFMSMIGAEILTTIINNKNITDAAEILKQLNDYVRTALKQDTTENQDGMDMALCIIDEKEKTVDFSGAKNPLFFLKDNKVHKIKGSRQSIGGFQFGEFESHTVKYESPTWFYIFSDGYADQFGGKTHSKFMIKRFKDLLIKIHKKPMKEQKIILNETINDWMLGTRQTDDILVIGFKL